MSRASLARLRLAFLALALTGLMAACAGQLPAVVPSVETPSVLPSAPELAPPAAPDAGLLALPAAFRYQVGLHPAGQPDAPTTLIVGEYREGAWRQLSGSGKWDFDIPDQELIVARDPQANALQSYTRAMTDTVWTRWPGVTFDTAYGLASPFTLLRLRPLAVQIAVVEAANRDVGPAGATRTQAVFSADVVKRLLVAGVSQVASNVDARAALEVQIASQFAPQTLYYWIDAEGQVRQVDGTLLTAGADGQPAPWLEVSAIFSDHDDSTIAVTVPTEVVDIEALAAAPEKQVASAPAEVDLASDITLRIRVFAAAGQPANDATVTVYPAGKQTVADEKLGPDAQFALKPGLYDILIRSAGAQQWLKEVAVTQGALASNDVLFEFAQLTVTVALNGAAAAVDMVVYPAGEKTSFTAFSSENPARFRVPVGLYDIEAATQDGRARKRVEGVEVRAGLETTLDLDLARP